MDDQHRVLARAVWVDGVKWSAGSTPPPEVAEKITNPRVWADPDTGETPPAGKSTRPEGAGDGTRLARTVHVGGRKYRPGDPIPDEVARQITNPKAWAGGRPPRLADGGPVSDPRDPDDDTILFQPQHLSPGEVAGQRQHDDDGGDAGQDTSVPPPRSGKGSGIGPWRVFADANEVAYPSEANRDDIIDACVKANVIPAE